MDRRYFLKSSGTAIGLAGAGLIGAAPGFFSQFAHAARATVGASDFVKRPVAIYSDGIKMAGDLYLPAGLKDGERRAAIVFCAGTGGTKAGNGAQYAKRFASEGYVVLAFDYRGWGESDGKLLPVEPLPKPDAKGEVTARVRVVRWQMDFADQTQDIRAAISFLAGEPSVDPRRIGLMGSSYGGGLVTWVAANDPRVKCVVAQVPGMEGGREGAAERRRYELLTKQSRGETEPVPFETGKPTGKMAGYQNMRYNPAKHIGFDPVEAAAKIKIPTLLVMAENDELIDNKQSGAKVYEIIKAKKDVPVEMYTIKGVTHYGIYRKGFAEATKLELEWFDKYLKAPASKPEM